MKCPYLKNHDCPLLQNDLENIHICQGYSCDNPVYVYIIRCKDETFYTGFTRNIERRIKEHKTGRGARYTKARGVKEYTFIQCGRASDGLKIEFRIKKTWNRSKKENLFKMYGTYK